MTLLGGLAQADVDSALLPDSCDDYLRPRTIEVL